jgi:hypothetical protein
MRKNILYITVLSLLFSFYAKGQDLRIPNTPAFSILGYEPTSVMRPTSAKKLSSDLLNSFDADGKLIMNLGLEVTPYWLKNRQNLTREQYLNPNTKQTILQTFTLSAATVKDSITKKNNLGVGFRFEIYKGKLGEDMKVLEQKELEIESILGSIVAVQQLQLTDPAAVIAKLPDFLKVANVSPDKITEVTDKANALLQYPTVAKDLAKFYDELQKVYIAESGAMVDRIRILEDKRTGFSLETAGAAKFITTSGNKSFQKAGFWLNANYYISEKDAWTVTARVMTNTSDTTAVNTDLGLSYIRQEKDFNVSVEAMMRWYRAEIPDFNMMSQPITRLEKDFTYRVAAQLSYSVFEDVSVNLSIGKEFDSPEFTGTGIFSILGINYTIFNRRYIP